MKVARCLCFARCNFLLTSKLLVCGFGGLQFFAELWHLAARSFGEIPS